MESGPILLFAGSGSQALTRRVADYLGVTPGRGETLRFSDGNLFVRIGDNVRGQSVYVVQSTVFPANDNFMELLFWIDAFKRASAASVTVIMPYFSYAKGDKKDEPRVSIRARVCADAIEAAGADRIVTVDLHAPQIQGFFRKPVDNLSAMAVLAAPIRALDLPNPVVVAPDVGFAKAARQYAKALGTDLAIADKERLGHDEHAHIRSVIGEVAGRSAVVVDDFTVSAGTLVGVAQELCRLGARKVVGAITHGVLTPPALEALEASPVERLFITDTVENHPMPLTPKVEVVSVAALLGEAIRRIHHRESISAMFV